MTLEWHWPILRQSQIWKLGLFYRKKWKQWIFRNYWCLWPENWLMQTTNWLNEGMLVLKVLDLGQGRVQTKIQTRLFQKLLSRSEPNFVWKLSGTRKWKFVNMMLVTWPRWPPCQYMVKTLQKSSSEQAGWFSRNLVCSIGDYCLGFSMGKRENSGIFRNYWSQWPESW